MRVSINTPEDCTINEQFIKLVQETPMLWNLHLPQYRNRELKEQKWAEVGALFNLSVSFSRDRRWTKPKHIIKNQKGPPMVLLKQDLAALIKSEFPEMHTSSTPTSPSYQISGEPSENGSNETYHDNSDFYNESTTQGANSDGADYGERIESIPDVHLMAADTNPGSSHESKILHRLESSTSGVLENYDRRKHSWARCETLGQRVAQTMYALEEHDPDLALKFDIMLSESITSIKKDQLQRLMSRKQMQQEEQQRNRNSEDSSLR
ncbi:uncharacterized protein LOC129776098 isoform X2 [Toxorhynchites rutilus septentrionalis]|uniref:uncharacterized protein LOC129776098 isoform X2 n=1 Tax=Toxorhynchites rutilus septentrionalis TaxID=329112 RepID=UPI00247AF138|nr:uncharacterized protein LOC129776098 isoform X2 [Toxorhynchites rutilus septentrionalis]